MIERKFTIRPKKVSKSQEDAYYESRKREREEKYINNYYEEKKSTLIPLIMIVTFLSYPFIKIGEIYEYCINNSSSSNKIKPEINE